MATGFCSVCGSVLRDGLCPQGHPQRAARRAGARRRRRWPWVLLVLFLIVAGAAYGALQWYPVRAAGDLMGPSSEEFVAAHTAYGEAVAVVPTDATDPRAVADAAPLVVERSEAARAELAQAQIRLEGRTAPDLPVVSERSPLVDAVELRRRMLRFYPQALEAAADLENLADYVTQVARMLPQLRDIESTLRENGADTSAAADATSVGRQLTADLAAITPAEHLGSVHASLQAIADQVVSDLEQASETGGQAAQPVLEALVEGVLADVRDLRAAIAAAPAGALEGELGSQLDQVDRLSARIAEDLAHLRDAGVAGLTLPDEAA